MACIKFDVDLYLYNNLCLHIHDFNNIQEFEENRDIYFWHFLWPATCRRIARFPSSYVKTMWIHTMTQRWIVPTNINCIPVMIIKRTISSTACNLAKYPTIFSLPRRHFCYLGHVISGGHLSSAPSHLPLINFSYFHLQRYLFKFSVGFEKVPDQNL